MKHLKHCAPSVIGAQLASAVRLALMYHSNCLCFHESLGKKRRVTAGGARSDLRALLLPRYPFVFSGGNVW